MLCIYVGDSSNVMSRLLTNHCAGNVEGSAFREAVAKAMGYRTTHFTQLHVSPLDWPSTRVAMIAPKSTVQPPWNQHPSCSATSAWPFRIPRR